MCCGLKKIFILLQEAIKIGPQKFQCPLCPRIMHSPGSIRQHIVTHTGEKPFKCTICAANYSQKSALLRHVRGKHNVFENLERF